MRCLTRTFALLVLSPALSFGSLTWENQTVELVAKPHEPQLTGIFHFKNTGNFPVTITALEPSCGCTTVELARKTYLPSETGEVKAVYTPNGAAGWQHKSIAVTTDDSTAKPVQLTLRINIPELLTCLPRMLLWQIGEKPDDKKAVISAAGSLKIAKIEILTITPKTDAAARLEHDPAGEKYTLIVHPSSTLSTDQAGVSCLATFADGTTQVFGVFALVR